MSSRKLDCIQIEKRMKEKTEKNNKRLTEKMKQDTAMISSYLRNILFRIQSESLVMHHPNRSE